MRFAFCPHTERPDTADRARTLNLTIEAMALQRHGVAGEATRELDQAQSVLMDHVPGIDADGWNEWLAAHILYREAEALVRAKQVETSK